MRTIKTLVLAMALVFVFSSARAEADVTGENGKVIPSASVNIAVTHIMTGDRFPGGDTVTYTLKAEDADDPMPEGSAAGVKEVKADAYETVDFGDIVVEHPDAYFYEVTRTYTDTKNMTHDARAYRVLVAKFNTGETLMVTWDRETEAKVDGVVFTDSYEAPSAPKTGDELPVAALGIFGASSALLLTGVIAKLIVQKRRKEDHDEE